MKLINHTPAQQHHNFQHSWSSLHSLRDSCEPAFVRRLPSYIWFESWTSWVWRTDRLRHSAPQDWTSLCPHAAEKSWHSLSARGSTFHRDELSIGSLHFVAFARTHRVELWSIEAFEISRQNPKRQQQHWIGAEWQKRGRSQHKQKQPTTSKTSKKGEWKFEANKRKQAKHKQTRGKKRDGKLWSDLGWSGLEEGPVLDEMEAFGIDTNQSRDNIRIGKKGRKAKFVEALKEVMISNLNDTRRRGYTFKKKREDENVNRMMEEKLTNEPSFGLGMGDNATCFRRSVCVGSFSMRSKMIRLIVRA